MKHVLSFPCFSNRTFQIGLRALLFTSCGVLLAACDGGVADSGLGAGGARSGVAGADNGGSEPHPTTLVFVPWEGIELKPKMTRQLTVQATPVGPFRIRFALEGGDDAVLDASEVETDAEGFARVTLTAPSKPSTFNVRASSTSAAQVKLGVSVSASGFTTLRVQPSYSGQRRITEWTASTRAGARCSDLEGNPPPDGDRTAKAKPDERLVISKVPVNVDLAVTVRAGHYIGGCVNVPALSEVEGNQVLVYTSDRPLNLGAPGLLLSLGASDPHPAFAQLISESATLAESALLGDAENDVAALLDGMRDATSPANREAFNVARAQYDWDGALAGTFGKSAARRLRDPAQRWLSAGLLALGAPDALVGQVQALGNGVSFTPRRVAAATPSSAGFPGLFQGTWSADSNDVLLLGIDLSWQPSRLVTALAVAPALLEFPEATSAELALSLSVDCNAVGQALLTYGANPGNTAFASCDHTCAMSLCRNAVAAAWNRAQLSSGAQTATLSITATGMAAVGDEAQATTLDGSWVGELRTDSGTAQVSGALSASSESP